MPSMINLARAPGPAEAARPILAALAACNFTDAAVDHAQMAMIRNLTAVPGRASRTFEDVELRMRSRAAECPRTRLPAAPRMPSWRAPHRAASAHSSLAATRRRAATTPSLRRRERLRNEIGDGTVRRPAPAMIRSAAGLRTCGSQGHVRMATSARSAKYPE